MKDADVIRKQFTMGNIKTSLAIKILLDTRLQGLQIGNIQIRIPPYLTI